MVWIGGERWLRVTTPYHALAYDAVFPFSSTYFAFPVSVPFLFLVGVFLCIIETG